MSNRNIETKLKTCPFCGGEASTSTYYIACDCEASPKVDCYGQDRQEAIKVWNTRHKDKWQPISIAPKDGTKILAFARDMYSTKEENKYQINTTWFSVRESGLGDWAYFSTHYPPTHWQPLPKPPTNKE